MRAARYIVLAAALALLGCGAWLFLAWDRSFDISPSPRLAVSERAYAVGTPSEGTEEETDPFPSVDWEHWRSVNPDVIGWVTVPGTMVDYPIVQAPPDDPTFYLDHDVYRKWSWMGCPYLDAECIDEGLDGLTGVISAHNLTDGSMFAAFAGFSDPDHVQPIYLQTPKWRRVLTVGAVDVISGKEAKKQAVVGSVDVLEAWYKNEHGEADVRIQEPGRPDAVYVFVTCSYTRSSNERTLVYGAYYGRQ
jgi:sortase B